MDIKISISGLDSALRMFDEKRVMRAAKMAINDTTKKVRTSADQAIRKKFALTTGHTKKMIRITGTASSRKLEGEITARSKPLSLKYFQTRQVIDRKGGVAVRQSGRKFDTYGKKSSLQRGLSVKILKEGGFRHVKGGFALRHSKGGLSHWRRNGPGSWGTMEGTKIIRVITIASMLSQKQVMDSINKTFSDTWDRRFSHHLDRELFK